MTKSSGKPTRDELWELLGEYAFDVGESNGVLFTDNVHILKAFEEHHAKVNKDRSEG